MPGLTLLDYQVFNHLRDHIEDHAPDLWDAFSEMVLGYGFKHDEDGIIFILLCAPQARDSLSQIIHQVLPEGRMAVDSNYLAVSIHDAIQPQELQHAVDLPDQSPDPSASQLSNETLTEQVQIALGQSVRQVILQEHRKVLVPSYLLRYTPFTSPNLIILRIALGQIHYLHSAGSQITESYDPRTVKATMTEISRWSSLSRTSIYRLLHEDSRCDWLVDVDNRGSFQNDQGQQIALSNAYLLKPLELTPGDATDLRRYLQENRSNWLDVDSALETLARINRREIFQFPYRLPQEGDDPAPASLQDIIRSVFGPFAPDQQRMALFDLAQENLQGKDFVTLPWYVFRKLLPVYGASIITLYLMSLPLLFNHAGVNRDTFWLPGGAEALVAWTGDKSIGKFFPKANPKGRGRPSSQKESTERAWRQNKREMLGEFFLRTVTRKVKGQTAWQIQVHEPPILPEDARLLSGTYHLLVMLVQEDRLVDLASMFENSVFSEPGQPASQILDQLYRIPLEARQRECLWHMADLVFSNFETPEESEFSNFETPVERIISLFETPEQPLFSKFATPAKALISYFETYLKILFRIKDSFKLKDSTFQPNSDKVNKTQAAASGWSDGSIQDLLKSSHPDYQEAIQQDSAKQRLFKAWLIQGALNPKVQQPLNLAISKVVNDSSPPEKAALRLAKASPSVLILVLERMRDNPYSMGYHNSAQLKQVEGDLALLLVGVGQDQQGILIQRLLDILGQSGIAARAEGDE